MATLDIRLFGTLAIVREGRSVDRMPGRRVRDLLAYLLLNRETLHSRDHLAGLFWGDQDDHRARHCLNTALWRLRQSLGDAERGKHPYLLVDTHHLGFNPSSDVLIDVDEFERLIGMAERAGAGARRAVILREAIALYRSDLLTDCYDDWCLLERERLQRLYLRSVAELLEHHASRGETEQALDCGHRILDRDPLREDIHRDVIRLYLESGKASHALRQYQACEAILRKELGVAPMPETQGLLQRLMASWDSSPSQPAPVRQVESITDLTSALRSALSEIDHARARIQAALDLVESAAVGYAAMAALRPGSSIPSTHSRDGGHREPKHASPEQQDRISIA